LAWILTFIIKSPLFIIGIIHHTSSPHLIMLGLNNLFCHSSYYINKACKSPNDIRSKPNHNNPSHCLKMRDLNKCNTSFVTYWSNKACFYKNRLFLLEVIILDIYLKKWEFVVHYDRLFPSVQLIVLVNMRFKNNLKLFHLQLLSYLSVHL
jgi:hypothetical protein